MMLIGLFHVLLSSLIALVLGALFGGLSVPVVIASLLLGLILAWPARGIRKDLPDIFRFSGLGVIGTGLVVFLLAAGVRHFAWLFFHSENAFRSLSQNNLGDLPLHINYIRQLAAGAAMPPINPEFASEKLFYPYAIDLYNALWETLGVPMSSHLFVSGLFLFVVTLAALRSWAGWIGIGGFFLNGGWAGWQVFRSGEFIDYQGPLAWKNFLLTLFITQRGLMFAVPAGLLVLIIAREALSGERVLRKRTLFGAGLLWGGMAFFHLHSFFIISLIIAGYMVLYRAWKPLRTLILPAVPLGAFFVLYSTRFFQKAGVAHLKWGWTAQQGESLLSYWWLNLGPWLVLFTGLVVWLLARKNFKALAETALYGGLFVLFTWVMLAPWEWDNIKILIWPYLGLLAVVWRVLPSEVSLRRMSSPSRLATNISLGVLAFVLFWSGTVSVFASISPAQTGIILYQARDLWNMEGALRSVPVDSILLAAPSYNHPLTYWGRIRVLGYEGHLWSHGIRSGDIVEKQRRIYAGDPDWLNLARELGATHIVWGPDERSQYEGMAQPWRERLQNVSSVTDYEIYEIQ